MLQPCDTGPAALAPESIALRSPQACRFRRSIPPQEYGSNPAMAFTGQHDSGGAKTVLQSKHTKYSGSDKTAGNIFLS